MSEKLHKAQVGRRLRAAIDALGLSQVDVARTLATSPSKLGNWLRGDNYPSEWFIKQFCDRYGVTTDWIYRGIVFGIASPDLADALWKSEQDDRLAALSSQMADELPPKRQDTECDVPVVPMRHRQGAS